jgi:hypothetical protein
MKKTIFALAVLAISGSAFACNYGSCNVPSKSSSSSSTAGSTASTGASAGSSGNGSAFSFNAATAFGSSSSTAGSTVGNVGSLSTGGAAVAGQAATGGSILSTSGSVGNAAAGGYAYGAACAEALADAKYEVKGKDPISGVVGGSVKSETGGLAQTFAGVGGGFAIAGGVAGNVGTFEATAGSVRLGSLVNVSTSNSGVTNTSTQLGGDFHVGNAGSSIDGYNFGNSLVSSNATAGNLCTTTSCANTQGKRP